MDAGAGKNAHNIFIVNDKPRTNIATKTTRGVNWGKACDGAIRVFFDDMTTPIHISPREIACRPKHCRTSRLCWLPKVLGSV